MLKDPSFEEMGLSTLRTILQQETLNGEFFYFIYLFFFLFIYFFYLFIFFFFITLKGHWLRENKDVKKKSHLSPDPAKRTVGVGETVVYIYLSIIYIVINVEIRQHAKFCCFDAVYL